MKDLISFWADIFAIIIAMSTLVGWLVTFTGWLRKGNHARNLALVVIALEISYVVFIGWVENRPQVVDLDVPTQTPILADEFVTKSEPTVSTHEFITRSEPTVSTSTIASEQAIREYFKLIADKQYSTAWDMYSICASYENLSFDEYVKEWKRLGTAEIRSLKSIENGQEATVTVTLYFSKDNITSQLIPYELIHDELDGNQRFGYWIFACK